MTDLHKARLVASLLGVVTILLVLSDALWGPGPVPITPPGGPRAVPSGEPGEGRSGSDRGQFRRRNPFQLVRVHPPPAPPPTTPPPPPRSDLEPVQAPRPVELPLKLVGTIAAGSLGMAFLAPNDGRPQLALSVGSDLGDSLGDAWKGWKLEQVERRSVTFRRGSESRLLEIGGTGKEVSVDGPSPPAPVAASDPGGQTLRLNVDRAEVDRARNNLAFLVTQLSVQPFFQAGRPAGVRVSRIRPGSFPARMGILNGDILQGVNGKPILTLQDTLALNEALQGGTDVTVNVLRGGRTLQLIYQIR